MNTPALPTHYSKHSSRVQHGVTTMKFFAKNNEDHVFISRKAFAALLRKAFPSMSDDDLARKAAKVLSRKFLPVSSRQVKNWLHCNNTAAWHYVSAVLAIAGAEIVFKGIE